MDAFQGLAQFTDSQKTLTQVIGQTVPLIDAQTSDQRKIDEASLALGAYLKMVTDIVSQASGARSLRVTHQDANCTLATETWRFCIAEKSVTVNINSQNRTVWVVTLTSADGEPTGLSDYPAVQIAGYQPLFIPELSDSTAGRYAWYYQNEHGEPLTADIAQSLAARTVELPGMQILERQDAVSTVYNYP
ncbi:hypothetical protein [Superficieibacter sp. HKU1]|uniref:hypothetical protein n=1 Tax=Superficieibacter sp. HKU1 TaxID=3031919 RepID=UPI0023E317E9|nr:hypothetical protein [Superficieibacter sp. HKU1]WES70357.1 hypothetical protein P0H77_10440 [Superficieibacter sp. HKU1]